MSAFRGPCPRPPGRTAEKPGNRLEITTEEQSGQGEKGILGEAFVGKMGFELNWEEVGAKTFQAEEGGMEGWEVGGPQGPFRGRLTF